MCGITGYIGHRDAYPIVIDGLQRLEYRGYDSAGIMMFDGKNILVSKMLTLSSFSLPCDSIIRH